MEEKNTGRVIKFRAWVKPPAQKGKMHFLDLESQFRDGRQSVAEVPFADDWNYEDCPLMQFTGLLDAKGREVFEGDIVSFASRLVDVPPGTKHRAVVSFEASENGYGLFLDRIDGHTNTFMDIQSLYQYDKMSAEVIGDIYQSPELLK